MPDWEQCKPRSWYHLPGPSSGSPSRVSGHGKCEQTMSRPLQLTRSRGHWPAQRRPARLGGAGAFGRTGHFRTVPRFRGASLQGVATPGESGSRRFVPRAETLEPLFADCDLVIVEGGHQSPGGLKVEVWKTEVGLPVWPRVRSFCGEAITVCWASVEIVSRWIPEFPLAPGSWRGAAEHPEKSHHSPPGSFEWSHFRLDFF